MEEEHHANFVRYACLTWLVTIPIPIQSLYINKTYLHFDLNSCIFLHQSLELIYILAFFGNNLGKSILHTRQSDDSNAQEQKQEGQEGLGKSPWIQIVLVTPSIKYTHLLTCCSNLVFSAVNRAFSYAKSLTELRNLFNSCLSADLSMEKNESSIGTHEKDNEHVRNCVVAFLIRNKM